MKKKYIFLGIVTFASIMFSGCGSININTNTTTTTTTTTTIPTTTITLVSVQPTELPSVDLDSPEVKVIYDYAELVNSQKYAEAVKLRDKNINDGITDNNYEVIRNIEKMEIVTLIEKPYKKGVWYIDNYPDIDKCYSVKVFYAEINYKLANIIPSGLHDGIYYHKISVIKATKDSPWLIGEMSTVDVTDKSN